MKLLVFLSLACLAAARTPAERALDAQDRAGLEKIIASLSNPAPDGAAPHHKLAMAQSLLAQLAIETGDKPLSKSAAEAGIAAARRAVELQPDSAEYHRVLGMLCGQVIPANVMAGLAHGKCALEELDRATQLDPKSPLVWLSRGVGNYYLPAMFGGGADKAIEDLRKSIELDPKNPEAHLWLGIALRKAGRNPEARTALQQSLKLNPNRKWAREQLEKTPAK